MKGLRDIFLALLLLSAVSGNAVTYCAGSSWGYAGNAVTGGGDATVTTVTSTSELVAALNKKKNRVVVITKDLSFSSMATIQDAENLTIMALPGVKLTSTQQSKATSGILFFKRVSNLIIRNITFVGPGAYDCDGNDLLCFENVTKAWVDHCDFQDGVDGNFDIKGQSDNLTVTWCRFRYLKKPKAGGPGGADDHRFSNLVGSSSSDKPADGIYNITYGYCWWDEGCKQRMTRCRNCELHFLNCYWNSSVSDYYIGPENSSCCFEGCTFAGKANSSKNIYKGFNNTVNYCKFVNCAGNLPAENGDVAAPAYAYDKLSAADAKAFVTNACGAGATLTTDEEATAYSACDRGETPPEIPTEDPVEMSGDCCVDLSLGAEPTVANKGIPSGFSKLSILVHLEKGKWEPGCLNMGGNADYITFDFSAYSTSILAVEFDVTIPLWTEERNTVAYHWNSGENSKHTISSAATETVHLTAPANAKSFTIQRSASTGTRISQICFELEGGAGGLDPKDPEEQEGLTDVPTKNAAQKVLRQGQILILREGKTYNLLGLYQ